MKMENWNFKIFQLVSVIWSLSTYMASSEVPNLNCRDFSSNITKIQNLVNSQEPSQVFLQDIGFESPDNLFGSAITYDKCVEIKMNNAKLHTVSAQAFRAQFNMSLDEFKSYATQCNTFKSLPPECSFNKTSKHPKYRTIDGRGNNLKHPEWGTANTPFLHFASKNYEDNVYAIKRSSKGLDLPNPRKIVQDVLWKAVHTTPPEFTYNVFVSMSILFVTHDVHYQSPTQPKDVSNEISCCSKNREYILPPDLSNLACLPIEISKNDSFYKHGNIGCLNMVRSQLGEFTNSVEPGQKLNLATSYMDMSLIYGNHDSDLIAIRLFRNGIFRMGRKNVLPVDSNGKFLPSMRRFTEVPIACLWPSLFYRNHNQIAQRLGKLNTHWTDEILFQEARRINIAITDYNFVTSKLIQNAINITGVSINETYSGVNPGVFIEFAICYRALHYYLHDWMLFRDANNKDTKYLMSDTVGNVDLLIELFDDAIRGANAESLNVGQFSDDLANRLGKDSSGYGTDLFAIDIQRARDHGCASYLEVRRKCKILPEINSFDDYNLIFNKTNVDLLRKTYDSYEDVEFYVAGLMEIFESLGNPLVGPTFGCIINLNHNNFVQGDIYYYTHKENPFTKAQIKSIQSYTLSNVICTNTGLNETVEIWPYALSPTNPIVSCDNFPEMDLTPWIEKHHG